MSSSGIPITIHSKNSVVRNNNQFVFHMRGGLTLKNMEVCLSKGFVFNSLFNVSASMFNNNVLQYTYPNGSSMNTYTITLQDGNYSVASLNAYINVIMLANKTYMIDNVGNNVYPISFNVNAAFYAVSVQITPVPTVLQSGWTLPSGAPALPSVSTTPQLVVLDNSWGKLIGYSKGSYPPVVQSSIYLVIGNIPAELNPQFAFNVCIDVVNTDLFNSVPSSFYPFSFDVGFFGQQMLTPYSEKYFPTMDGKYSQITISILDQSGVPALLQDPNSSFTIEFRPIVKK